MPRRCCCLRPTELAVRIEHPLRGTPEVVRLLLLSDVGIGPDALPSTTGHLHLDEQLVASRDNARIPFRLDHLIISEDPIGLAGGIDLYAYANNNPELYNDPFGYYAAICLRKFYPWFYPWEDTPYARH